MPIVDTNEAGAMKPVLAITMGDPSGIGPEIIAKCLESASRISRPIVFGHWPTLRQALNNVGANPRIQLMERAKPAEPHIIAIVPTEDDGPPIEEPGERSSRAQFEALEKAVDSALEGTCDCLATGPVSKEQISRIAPGFIGHTEYLAERCGLARDDVTMIFMSEKLAVGLLATHVPMDRIARTITTEHYERTTGHMVALLKEMHPDKRPRIAIAAFNPHAGEGGLLGNEEAGILEPFCRDIRGRVDAEITGPTPADTVFRDAMNGRYDGVIAAYHDQAMIPLKLMGNGQTVNVTMGLPFVRTSPDHGTAHDIAGTGVADPAGMRLAIDAAVKLWRARTSG